MAAILCRALFLAAWSWGDMGREGLSRATNQAQGRHGLVFRVRKAVQGQQPELGTRLKFEVLTCW